MSGRINPDGAIIPVKCRKNKIKMKRKMKFIVMLAIFALSAAALPSKSVYQQQFGNREAELELDAYYTSFDFYQPLTNTPIPQLGEISELGIYKKMLTAPRPRFLVFEASAYPMPCLGILIKKQLPEFYGKLSVSDDFNIIESLCAGFEEPYAASLFLGDVVSFAPKNGKGESGKGYTGLLVSAGNYNIKDNEAISDNWAEAEVKIKGDMETKDRKMSWSFRAGAKFHGNPDIKDVMYFSVRRDRTDYNGGGGELFANGSMEYSFDIDAENGNFIRHYFLVGKKFPLGKKKLVFSIGTGFLWEGSDKYTGRLKRTGIDRNFQILLRPNLEF